MRPILSRIWARALLSPTTRPVKCAKIEASIPWERGNIQLWGEWSGSEREASEETPDLVVLRFLGARGRAELATADPANRLPELRSITWTFNPPGFGRTSGPLSLENYFLAALTAFDFVAARHPGVPVWVYGKSIGATCALYVAARREPAALIAKNIIDVRAVSARRVGQWLAKRVPEILHLQPLAAAARSPALFVISSDDQLSPPESQESIANRYAGPVAKLHVDGGHDQAALMPEDELRYASFLRALSSRWPAR